MEVIVKAGLQEAKQPGVHNEDRTGVGEGGAQITLCTAITLTGGMLPSIQGSLLGLAVL